MRQVEFWRWRYVDPESGAARVTSYRMEADEALRRFPGAQPVEGTLELRNLPDSRADWNARPPGPEPPAQW